MKGLAVNCPKCNGEMDIHYGEWCPVCDKPKPPKHKLVK